MVAHIDITTSRHFGRRDAEGLRNVHRSRYLTRPGMTNRLRDGLLRFLATGLLYVFFNPALSADDQVMIEQQGRSRLPITGEIENFTGRELTMRTRVGKKIRIFPKSEVVEVIASYTQHHDLGRQMLARGRILNATVELNLALNEEDRTWVHREILASLVKCSLWTGDYLTAASDFLKIVASDEETFHYNVAPLAWADDVPDIKLVHEAKLWMSQSSPASKLMGASHLLCSPDSADESESTLRQLSRNSNLRIQRLAQMQLWRSRTMTGASTSGDLTRWEASLEELPQELRAGGYFVLGQAHRKQMNPERSANALLWLPLVYDTDRQLAARACFQAAEQLELIGDHAQAINLFSDMVFRYGDTRWGSLAEVTWKEIRAAHATP